LDFLLFYDNPKKEIFRGITLGFHINYFHTSQAQQDPVSWASPKAVSGHLEQVGMWSGASTQPAPNFCQTSLVPKETLELGQTPSCFT
jgi:hypothetical protein